MKKFSTLLILTCILTVNAQESQSPFAGIDMGNPFRTIPDRDAKVSYHNPVIPGFHSDPSVCRVGEDYYLITSTFEYFPGVPVFHSRDLVNWEQIGYCLDRKEQMPNGLNIFASTIRHHDGTFYMITTNITGGGNFYVTATDPAGPWSNPVWVKVPGIDPDLFWDEDGKSYVISSPLVLYEINLETGELLTEGRKVWNGTGGRYAEGPHIYKKDGYYYLMAAEGGTEEAHSETIARSNNIWGPYTEDHSNPILTHCNAAGQGNPIQGVGHADIVQAQDDSWWIVFHGYRTISDKAHHILGRETCLAPVTWPKNGWPVVNGNGTATVDMTCPTLPLQPFREKPARVDFDKKQMGMDWNHIGFPEGDNYSLTARTGYLRLKGAAGIIGGRTSPTFVGRRLENLYFTATTRMEFDPTATGDEEAGMVLENNGSHFDLLVHQVDGKRFLVVKLQFGQTVYRSKEIALKPGPVNLRVQGRRSTFTFSYSQGEDAYRDIETVDAKFLATETVGFFTGVYVGLYATGNGQASNAYAYYDWFEYQVDATP
jgi:xylan 1,4-beta-xylosidase